MKRFLRAFKRKRRSRSAGLFSKKIAVMAATAIALILIPSGSANAAPSDVDPTDFLKALTPAGAVAGWLSDECKAPGLPPEVYGSGFDGLAKDVPRNAPRDWSFYGQYGTSGQYWNWVGIGCTDILTKTGNQAANLIFDISKTVDTVTITVYKAAASESLISWLKDVTDKLIGSIGHALQARYLMPIVMLGALALIWWGLFKRRATKVTEGTIWMVCATVALMALIGKPEMFTTAGTAVTSATDSVVNAALSPVRSDAKQSSSVCIPTRNKSNPQYTGKWTDTDRNANAMWSVLVCKPWLQGEFGTADPNSRVVKDLAYNLIVSQAFTENDVRTGRVTDSEVKNKQNTYLGVTSAINSDSSKKPGDRIYNQANFDLFSGKLYTQRIGIAFAALFAAVVAGILILLLSLALIIFKLGFLLLLIAGPVFLLIGVHPGWGRVIAIRWVELLLSTLLKQALVAGILALLLFFYSLIMGGGNLSWVMQIVLIALVSFAAFFYRKPFQHLFAAVGTDSIGARVLNNATSTNAFKTGAKAAVPPLTATRAANRWSARKLQPVTDAASATGHPAAMAVGLGTRLAAGNPTDDDVTGRTAGRINEANRARAGEDGGSGVATSRPTTNKRSGTSAPPLNLPSRPGENPQTRAAAAAAGTRGGVRPGSRPGAPGSPRPSGGSTGGSAPVTGTGGVLAGRSSAGSAPRRGDAPPPMRTSRTSGSAPPRRPSGGGPAPSSSDGGGSPNRSGGGLFGSSWRRSGGDGPESGGGGGGGRRSGGGGWFGGGGGSRRGGGNRSGDKRESAPPSRRAESSDKSSGPAPWRKRESAPPLWARPTRPQNPDIPFWTRPDK